MKKQITFGSWLREKRKDREMTVELLAHHAGLSVAHIYNLEQDKAPFPSGQTLFALADALHLPMDAFKPFFIEEK